MHAELAASLLHLSDAAQDELPAISTRLAQLAAAIRAGKKMVPEAFRAYYRLVPHLAAGDAAATEAQLARLESFSARRGAMVVRHFGQPEAETLVRELIADGMELAPIDDGLAAEFEALLREGLELMADALPDLHGEITSIVREVLLVQAPAGAKVTFDGASHYQFWGLLLLNPNQHKTPNAIVEVLAHEAAHSLLFGRTIEEPLVHNSDDDLFDSPLRQDPRPMDGIYHAAFVSARMAYAMEELAASGRLTGQTRQDALAAARKDRENFAMGLSVVDAHGDLSATGARIMEGARQWISQTQAP